METLYITDRNFKIVPYGKGCVIGTGTRQEIVYDLDMLSGIIALGAFCAIDRDKKSLMDYIDKSGVPEKSLDFMLQKGFIGKKTSDTGDRYDRNYVFYESLGLDSFSLKDAICEKHILIVGCGGIGNALSYSLCGMGVGKITLVDHDVIEMSNLNRQFLFSEEDLGEFKVVVLKKELTRRNKNSNILVKPERISRPILEEISQVDFVFVSSDEEASLDIVNKYCVEKKIPYLNVGYLSDISIIGPIFIPGISACYDCDRSIFGFDSSTLSKEDLESINIINSRYTASSSMPNNFIASSMGVVDMLFYFSNKLEKINSLNTRVGISNRDFSKYEIRVNRNKDCKTCS